MRALIDWCAGDGVALAALEVLGMIAVLVGLAWAAERGLARRPALRAALWLAALIAVLLAPAFVVLGRQLPWRVALFPPAGPAPDLRMEGPQPEVSAAPAARAPQARQTGGAAHTAAPPRSHEIAPREGDRAVVASRTESPVSSPAPPPSALVSEEAPGVAAPPPAPSASSLRAIAAIALLAWGVGGVYLGARLLYGVWRVRRLWCRLRPLDGQRWAAELAEAARVLSVARLPEIRLSPDVRSPLVAGLFPPRVVLPESLPECGPPQQLVAVLVHECAHVLRRDPWVRLLQRLAAALYWVHPLVRLLNRRLDQAREEVCDNHVLAYADAPSYAETLLTVAQLCYPVPRLEGYLTMMPRHYTLERRVADLLEERRDPATRLPARQRAALLAALVLLLVAASSVGLKATVGAAAQAPKEQAPAAADKAPAPTSKLTGQVLHAADGAPAAGAVVWAAKFDYGPLVRRETVADAKGRYELALTPGDWYLWARRGTQGGEGRAPGRTIKVAAGRTVGPVTIHLEERGTFRGRLLEHETGKPIPGGRLFLDAGLVLTADPRGRFEVGGLARTNHEAFVVAPGRMRMRVLFDTTARADTELDVPVPVAGKLVGLVTDADGKPIPGACVGRHTSGSFFSINGLFVACDPAGRFEYDDAVPPDQPTRLTASAPGFVDDERGNLTAPQPGKPLVVDFRLRPKPGTPAADRVPGAEKLRAVTGVVRGPDGKPAAGVVVRWGYEPYVGSTQTKTDAEGRFRLNVPDKANMVAVLPRAFPPQFPRVEAGGDQKVEVTLKAGGTARGRVLDDTGKPIPGVQVIAVTSSPDPRIGNPFWLSEAAVHTDAAGKFEVKGVPDGARFDFLKQGLSDVRNHTLDLAKADNTVTMQYGGAVSGRVVGQDGKPVRDFRIIVGFPRERRPGDQTSGFFAGYSGIGVRFTSPDGSFVLTGVGAGSVYRITALAKGHGEAVADRVTAVPVNRLKGTEPAVLRAGAPVRLRVRALTTKRKPIPDARVTLVNGEPGLDSSFMWGYHNASWEDMGRGRTGADGWVDFPALSFGAATLLVEAPGYARYRVGWRDGAKELTCELSRESVLAGEVRDTAGKPVETCYVNLTGGGDQIAATVEPDDKGRFRIAELPAGTWKVLVRSADGRSTLYEKEVKLRAGEATELKIKVRKE
jgi:beta-lactamase regulating signal transducer with metallopeptidase domain/uncharacterized GH25 family protein